MWPASRKETLLEVQPATMERLHVGDCITYRLKGSGSLVTHRIIAIHDMSIITRGDASPCPDDLKVDTEQLVGRVIGRFRLGVYKPVRGGIKGQITGKFYRYAGRLDPQRDARGGRAARLLRSSLQWLAAAFYRCGTVHKFGKTADESNTYWLVGQHPLASFDHLHGDWRLPWPQSLLIDPARLPIHSQT